MNMHSLSDQELLRLYKAEKKNKWLGILLERYTLLLLGVCMKYLRNEEQAKDMVQQVFEKIIREIDRHEINSFGAWIYRIAVNECLMQLRKKRIKTADLEDKIPAFEEDPTIDWENEKEKDRILLHQSMNQLSSEQRICIEQFYFHKKSYRQIVSATGFSLKEVKSYIQNGKRNLKNMLKQDMKT